MRALARCLPCGSDCFPRSGSKANIESEKELEEYTRLVNFLSAVPLFKKQLPKDDLPKLADSLKRMEWPVGTKVIEQGEEGKAFFIIVSGEASVVTMDENDHEIPLATLYNMDYFGGHTLTSRRSNVATVRSKGPEPLVTLSLSRDRFVRLGLDQKLKLPRRPAIYDGKKLLSEDGAHTLARGATATNLAPTSDEQKLTMEEVEFVCKSVEHNANLRARTAAHRGSHDLHNEAVQNMAKTATKLSVAAGEEICKGGQVGTRFIVIATGHFDILHNPTSTMHQGVEAMVAKSHVTERLLRKHRFLLNMFKKGHAFHNDGLVEANSMLVTSASTMNKEPPSPRQTPSLDICKVRTIGTARDDELTPVNTLGSRSTSRGTCRTTDDVDPSTPSQLRKTTRLDALEAAAVDDLDLRQSAKRKETLWRRNSFAPGAESGAKTDSLEFKASATSSSTRQVSEPTRQVSEDSQYKPGDLVYRVVVGDANFTKERGEVIEVLEDGPDALFLVEFPEPEGKVSRTTVRGSGLRPVQVVEPVARLGPGECFGELCLLYNTRQVATCRAVEDSVIYTIDKKRFQECFTRSSPHHDEYCKLFDEVHLLTPLLRAERMEIARKVTGRFVFPPNEVVVRQGEIKPERLWYVIEKYDCTIYKETPDGGEEKLRTLYRAEHFGERQIFMGDVASEFTVKAGKQGLVCVAIDGDLLQNLPLDKNYIMAGKVFAEGSEGDDANENLGSVPSDLATYVKALPKVSEKFEVPLENLELVGVLGEGGFGSVLLAQHEGKEYALKRLSKGWVVQSNVTNNVVAERDLLAMMSTPFIIRLYRSYRDEQWVYMLIEYCPGGHLLGLMEKHKEVLTRDKPRGRASMFYAICVSHALEYLHDKNIMYRDLKLENVLLDELGYAKLCDMGFARFVHGKSNTQAGTPDYMAPEMIDPPHAHDRMVDWYALGVLTCELLSGQVPYDDQGLDDISMCLEVLRVAQDRGIPKNYFGPSLVLAEDFVRKLLTVDPRRRLGAKEDGREVRSHSWLKDFPFDDLLNRTYVAPFRAPKSIMEKRLGTTRTVKDHIKIDTNLFRVYEESMVDDHDWDIAFDS